MQFYFVLLQIGCQRIPRIFIGEVDQRREGHLSNANIFSKAGTYTWNAD